MRALITGGAGFIGSHLARLLVSRGWNVTCLDNQITGSFSSIAGPREQCRGLSWDVTEADWMDRVDPVDAVFHLASPASLRWYRKYPLQTMAANSVGTENALHFAERCGARLLYTSTSEIYGSPEVTPQPEEYWGNVNPVGERSVYDESKRYGEALVAAYQRLGRVDTRTVRIFNTYGPGLVPEDGRVVSTFLAQALTGEPLTIFGSGEQTRSLCYVDDLVRGLWTVFASDCTSPVNLGNPTEMTVNDIAETVLHEVVGPAAGLADHARYEPLPPDDPCRRCPDISLARSLGWEPETSFEAGLAPTIQWIKPYLAARSSLTLG